jgi:hypothetical protein
MECAAAAAYGFIAVGCFFDGALYSYGRQPADPTGLIACPQPCNVSYAAAYSLYTQNTSRYAASWEFAGNNFDALVQYEFENHILQALGYDMRWR